MKKYLLNAPAATVHITIAIIVIQLALFWTATTDRNSITNILIYILGLLVVALTANLVLATGSAPLRMMLGCCLLIFIIFWISVWIDLRINVD